MFLLNEKINKALVNEFNDSSDIVDKPIGSIWDLQDECFTYYTARVEKVSVNYLNF